jgi:hypothetical protein
MRVVSSQRSLEAVDEPPQRAGREPGPYYVATRLGEFEGPGDGEFVARACARCGELTGVVTDDAPLAESCAGVLCTECSGTPSGILYIPSQNDL